MRDYYVVNQWNVIQNDEPFTTFNQAWQFKGMVQLRFPLDYKIISVERDWLVKYVMVFKSLES